MKKITIKMFMIIVLLGIPSLLWGTGGSEDSGKVEFVIANGTEPSSLDPHKVSGVPEHYIYRALFEGLIRPNGKTGLGEPGMAESWTVSDDKKLYTFTLREGLVWSDGVPITAETVVRSWLRGLDPNTASPYAWFPSLFIKGAKEYNTTGTQEDRDKVAIRALDDRTFQMETIGPMAYTVDSLYHYSFAVVPLHTIEKYGVDWILPENFVGNGPFVLDKWNPQEDLVGIRNDKYWDKENLFIDEIVFLPTEEINTVYNMYLNNEVDFVRETPSEKFAEIRGRADVHVYPTLATYYYMPNLAKPPLDNKDVRLALYKVLGRKTLTERVTGEGQLPAYGMVPPMANYTSPAFPEESEAEAKALLAKAGYPNGEGFPELTILYNTSENHKKIAEYIQQRLKNILNITINLENQEWKTYLETRRNHDFDLARAGWVGDYLDPGTFLELFTSGSDFNDMQYENPAYDKALQDAAQKQGTQRMALLKKAEDMLIQDVAVFPMYHYVEVNLVDTSVWDGWYGNIMQAPSYLGIKKVK